VQCGTFSANRNAWIFEIALDDTVNVIEQFAGTGEMFVYPNPATTNLAATTRKHAAYRHVY
jgi:hypothetical protein